MGLFNKKESVENILNLSNETYKRMKIIQKYSRQNSYQEAFKHADKGDFSGLIEIGSLLHYGEIAYNVTGKGWLKDGEFKEFFGKDWGASVKIFEFVVENKGHTGNSWIYTRIAEMYFEGGNGIEKDVKKSAEWAKREPNERYLAGIYMYGKYGVEVDKELAFKMYKTFAQNGDYNAGTIVGMVGFKCPRCENFMSLNTLSCNNCGGAIYETKTHASRATGVNTLTGEVHYQNYSTGKELRCEKCDKGFNGWHCPKCNTLATMGNYGLHK